MADIMEQLQAATAAALKSGKTKYRIAKDAGLESHSLTRLIENPATVTFEKAAKLAASLGLEFQPVQKPSAKSKGKR